MPNPLVNTSTATHARDCVEAGTQGGMGRDLPASDLERGAHAQCWIRGHQPKWLAADDAGRRPEGDEPDDATADADHDDQ